MYKTELKPYKIEHKRMDADNNNKKYENDHKRI